MSRPVITFKRVLDLACLSSFAHRIILRLVRVRTFFVLLALALIIQPCNSMSVPSKSGGGNPLPEEGFFVNDNGNTANVEEPPTALSSVSTTSMASHLKFDDGIKFVFVPQSDTINLGLDMTIEFWIKTTTRFGGPNWHDASWILDKDIPGVIKTDWAVVLRYGKVVFDNGNPNGNADQPLFGNQEINDGIWHHVAITRDSNSGHTVIYIDREIDAEGNFSIDNLSNTLPLYIGAEQGGTGGNARAFKGEIDDVRLWNIVRSREDLQATMNETLNGDEPGLMGNWLFDEGAGQIAEDNSINQNDGQLGSSIEADSNDPNWIPSVDRPQYDCNAPRDETDRDHDGFSNLEEWNGWRNHASYLGNGGTFFTNPCDPDTDDDGILDKEEEGKQLNPLDRLPYYSVDYSDYEFFRRNEYNEEFEWELPAGPTTSMKLEYAPGDPQDWNVAVSPNEETSTDSSDIKVAIQGIINGPTALNHFVSPNTIIPVYEESLGTVKVTLVNPSFNYNVQDSKSFSTPFYLTVEPIINEVIEKGDLSVPPYFYVNVDLTASWTLIDPNAPAILKSIDSADGCTIRQLAGVVEEEFHIPDIEGLPFSGWGMKSKVDGSWGLITPWLEYTFEPEKKYTTGTDQFPPPESDYEAYTAQRYPLPNLVQLSENFSGVRNQISSCGLDMKIQFHYDKDPYKDPTPRCPEVMMIQLNGGIEWVSSEPSDWIARNYIYERVYVVLQSGDYYLGNTCNNIISDIKENQSGSIISENLLFVDTSNDLKQDVFANEDEVFFKQVSVYAFDSDNNSTNDAVTISWDADTELDESNVSAEVRIGDPGETTRFIDGPYTIQQDEIDPHEVNFYEVEEGLQIITAKLFDSLGNLKDIEVRTVELEAGPGDMGQLMLTGFNSSVVGQSAEISWTANTNLPQESASVLVVINNADGISDMLAFGPYVVNDTSPNPGQVTFDAPSNGYYEATVILLDGDSKVEDEATIPIAIGLPEIVLTPNYIESLVDEDGDGKSDTLQIALEAQFGTEGEYLLEGKLYDSERQLIATAHSMLTATAGTSEIALHFDGLDIYHHGAAGPYTLDDLQLHNSDNILVAVVATPYTTEAYPLGVLGTPPGTFADVYSDQGFDTTGDGFYDWLRVGVDINVIEAGFYRLQANLRDVEGQIISTVSADEELMPGIRTMVLSFDGMQIYEGKHDGPYTLTGSVSFLQEKRSASEAVTA